MIPVETVLICQIESIREVSSRRDRVLGHRLATCGERTATKMGRSNLGDTRHTVHMRCSTLKDACEGSG
jgi:hypothetical protein